MQKKFLTYSIIAGVLLILFCALTVSLTFVDVREAGESGAPVGFATLNEAVFDTLGQNEICLKISGLCGKLIFAAVGAFGITGLVQVIRRKGILRADKELYAMVGGFALFGAAYLLFEVVVINCRPILEDGELAASMRYLNQRFSMPDRKIAGILTDVGTEELGHLEMVGTIVHQLTKGLSEDELKKQGFSELFITGL